MARSSAPPGKYHVYEVGERGWYHQLSNRGLTLDGAKKFARIGARHGSVDRVVALGNKIVRRYEAGTGERLA